MKITKEVIDMIQVGNKLQLYYSKGNINNSIFEIRGIVDKYYVVTRSDKVHTYKLEHIYFFQIAFNQGNLSLYEYKG